MEKQRQRFSINDELILLKQTLSENPYEDAGKWHLIQNTLNNTTNKLFTVRALKDHVQYLITCFIKEDMKRRKSVTEEEYTELQSLLQNIYDLSKKCSFKRKLKKSIDAGKKARDKCVWDLLGDTEVNNEGYRPICDIAVDDDGEPSASSVTVNEDLTSGTVGTHFLNDSTSRPSLQSNTPLHDSGRKRTQSLLNFIINKQQQDRELKAMDLELQRKKIRLKEEALEIEKQKLKQKEEKLKFEKYKFEIEVKEQEIRLQMELKETRKSFERKENGEKLC